MKNLLLIAFTFIAINLFAQDEPKGRVPFASLGVSWTPSEYLTYSGEVGIWGTTKLTSFSIPFDVVTNVNKDSSNVLQYWIGFKPYYTVYSDEKLCYMLYVAPKVLIGSGRKFESLLEIGFNPNYTLHKNWLLGVTVGNQTYKNSVINPFISTGIVYLLN